MKHYFALLFLFHQLLALSQSLIRDSISLNEFVIAANRVDEPKKYISRQVLRLSNENINFLNQQTTADLLFQTGNVFIQKSQQGGGSPIIRGMEANRVLIVIDGIKMNNAIYRGGHLHNVIRIDQQILENAEVLFGTGSIVYGSDALGGVMHFTTKTPTLNNKSANIFYRFSSANNESTYNINIMQGFKKWGFILNYTSSKFDDLVQGKNRNNAIGDLGLRPFFAKRIDTADVVVANNNIHKQIESGYKQSDVFFKFLFEPNKNFQHLVNFQYSTTGNVPRYDRLSEFKNNKPIFSEWYYGPEQRTFATYQLNVNKKTNFYDKAKNVFGYQNIEESRHTRNFNSDELKSRIENVNVISFNTDFIKNINKNQLRYGAEIIYNHVNSTAYANNIKTNNKNAISTRYPDGGSHFSTASVYITNNNIINHNFTINYGLRYNYIYLNCIFKDKSIFPFLPDQILQVNHSINATIGSTYNFNNGLKLYANITNGFRAPNVDDISKIFESRPGVALILPNEKLRNEQSINSEIGVTIANKKLSFDGNMFYTKLFDAIVLAPTKINGSGSVLYDDKLTPVFSNQNVQSAYIVGFVANASYTIARNYIFKTTYNITYGDILKPAYMPLDHIPPAFGRSGITYKRKLITTELYCIYTASKRLSRYNLLGEDNIKYATENGLPAWQTLNYRISLSNKKQNIHVNIAVENIFDLNYRLFASGISAAGRNFIVSLKYTF